MENRNKHKKASVNNACLLFVANNVFILNRNSDDQGNKKTDLKLDLQKSKKKM